MSDYEMAMMAPLQDNKETKKVEYMFSYSVINEIEEQLCHLRKNGKTPTRLYIGWNEWFTLKTFITNSVYNDKKRSSYKGLAIFVVSDETHLYVV